jgi:hypothetical protein
LRGVVPRKVGEDIPHLKILNLQELGILLSEIIVKASGVGMPCGNGIGKGSVGGDLKPNGD